MSSSCDTPTAASAAATLDLLAVGAHAWVAGVEGEKAVARRLMELGLVEDTRVEIVRQAPFGDPIEVLVRGYHLTLRRSEARQIRIRAR